MFEDGSELVKETDYSVDFGNIVQKGTLRVSTSKEGEIRVTYQPESHPFAWVLGCLSAEQCETLIAALEEAILADEKI